VETLRFECRFILAQCCLVVCPTLVVIPHLLFYPSLRYGSDLCNSERINWDLKALVPWHSLLAHTFSERKGHPWALTESYESEEAQSAETTAQNISSLSTKHVESRLCCKSSLSQVSPILGRCRISIVNPSVSGGAIVTG
jgi:hypothetical protein